LSRDTVKYASTLMKAKLQHVESYLMSKEGETIDFQDLAYKLIFDVFLNLAFGVELDQLDALAEQTIRMEAFVDAFNKLQYYTHLRFNDLLWEIKQKYCIGERERNVKKCKQVIDDFAYGLIRQTKQNTSYEGKDIVSRFLKYNRESKEAELSEKELRDFVMTFVMAGRDTTAAALSWTLFELTKHPTLIDIIREEVDRVCKDDNFTIESIEALPFTNAVIMETLRLHSPVPDNFRFAVKDDTLPDGTVIPAGSLVMYSPYTINHSDKVWGTDADQFDPTRWLDRGESSPSKFPTFNLGPRTCPGKNLALMELKMSLAFLISKFDFEDLVGHSGEYRWTLILAMKGGFPVRVTKRKV
jgi:cytochrome P450